MSKLDLKTFSVALALVILLAMCIGTWRLAKKHRAIEDVEQAKRVKLLEELRTEKDAEERAATIQERLDETKQGDGFNLQDR